MALRERVDRAYAVIKDVRPDEAMEAMAACIPWPWMVTGEVSDLPGGALRALHRHPIIVLWRGHPPLGSPERTRIFDRFAPLAAAVVESLRINVGGMRLAIGNGVELPGGGLARSAELQALVGSHPHPMDLRLEALRSATRVLSSRGIPCRPVRDRARGTVSLVELRAALEAA